MKLALQYEMQRPYVDDHKVVQETMEQNFSRYVDLGDVVGDRVPDDAPLDFSGGAAIAHQIWEGLDADPLCDRAVIIASDPDNCIEALKKHENTSIDQMLIMIQRESVPHETVMKSIELFGKYVIPEFKSSVAKV